MSRTTQRFLPVLFPLAAAALAACAKEPDAVSEYAASGLAACIEPDSETSAASNDDALVALLAASPGCLRNVVDLRARLTNGGTTLETTLVNNRGFHSATGSYSIFEVATGPVASRVVSAGELFFGHFVAAAGNQLVLDQTPSSGALLVELIAWDRAKGAFNFYELIGDGKKGRWHYRGDSVDIKADVTALHQSRPAFGTRLRCSGCHVGGGPIMKEIEPPHNDWWTTARPLSFSGRTPDASMAGVLGSLVDASRLADGVKAGTAKLEASAATRPAFTTRSLRERLRPLFCPEEVNLVAASAIDGTSIDLPTAAFVDPRLLGSAPSKLTVTRAAYESALTALGASFPETNRRDGDHAWLAPSKGHADRAAVDALIAQGVIDEELALDVLAIDFVNPAFSARRCALLALVPETIGGSTLRAALATNLSGHGTDAEELRSNLVDPARDATSHRTRAAAFLDRCTTSLADSRILRDHVRVLAARRSEVAENPISTNPDGQILEPGFRVLFPMMSPAIRGGTWTLDEDCHPMAKTPAAWR